MRQASSPWERLLIRDASQRSVFQHWLGLTFSMHQVPAAYGLVGVVMAGLVGGIRSTIDSMMNATATLFTFDIYQKYVNPKASEQRLICVGRVAMIVLVGIAIWLSLQVGETKGGIFNTMADYTPTWFRAY